MLGVTQPQGSFVMLSSTLKGKGCSWYVGYEARGVIDSSRTHSREHSDLKSTHVETACSVIMELIRC